MTESSALNDLARLLNEHPRAALFASLLLIVLASIVTDLIDAVIRDMRRPRG